MVNDYDITDRYERLEDERRARALAILFAMFFRKASDVAGRL